MLVWILMALDVLSFFNLTLLQFGADYARHMLLLSGIYFIGKWFLFRDFMSIIDAACGVYIIVFAYIFGLSTFFYFFILIWIFYKFAILLVASMK